MSDEIAKKPRKTDADIEAANQIYKFAREEADVEMARLRIEMKAKGDQREAMGVLKKIQCDRVYNDLMEAVVLFRVKDNKLYKEGGFNWEDFCEAINVERRTADNIINDIRPIFSNFTENVSGLFGVPLNKIRYLGKANPENVSAFANMTPEEIEAYIDKLKDENRLQKEDHEAQKKAFDRVQEDSHKTITKMEKELDKFKREAERRGIPAEDDAFLKLMERARVSLDGALMYLDPDNIREELGDTEPTSRMTAAYLSTLDYARKQILAVFDTAQDMFGSPVISPEEAWRPGIKLPDDFVPEAGK